MQKNCACIGSCGHALRLCPTNSAPRAAGGNFPRRTIGKQSPCGKQLRRSNQSAVLADSSIQTDLPFQPRFFEDGDQLTALVPVSYALTPGAYTLTVTSGELTARYTIAVDDRVFEIQYLTVDPTVTANTAGSADANLEWETKVEPLKQIADPQKYWEGAFLQPVQGEITTEFGMIRYTNGSTDATRHSGIDIAAATGTQVSAPNNGRVIFAEFLQLTGNTVIVEHGLGLKSFFYHMDSLDVKEGDQLKKGDPVGKVGSTGFSTGAHLHYCLAVNNVFVNPWTAFENGIYSNLIN